MKTVFSSFFTLNLNGHLIIFLDIRNFLFNEGYLFVCLLDGV
jgi:hypothetical protein